MGILGLGERRLHEPKPNGTWGNTGNLVDLLSSDVRFYSNGFGGYFSTYPGETWAQLLSHPGLGSLTVAYVLLDLDAGFAGDQHLLVNNFTLHNDVFTTPLPLHSRSSPPAAACWRRKRKHAAST
jgi:hypothetical protein